MNCLEMCIRDRGQLLRFGLQQLVEGFLYASAHKFLELPLDNFFV